MKFKVFLLVSSLIAATTAGRYVSTFGTFLQSGTGATLRTIESKDRDIISVKDFGACGDNSCDSTTAFNNAITYCKTLPGDGSVGNGGCTIYVPEGVYGVTSINLSNSSALFYRQIRIKGAGRWATTIVPRATGNILIDMIGTNYASIEDLAIDSTALQSQTAIFQGRSTVSANANNNRFERLHILGNYSKAAFVSIAAESTGWYGVRFENSNSSTVSWTSVPSYNPKYVAFYTADDNTQIGISTTNGTIQTGPNTDNVMLDCEFYQTADNAVLTYFRNTAGYRFVGGSWIAGTQNGIKLIVLQAVTGNIFNGSMDFVGPHFEWFGTGTAIYLDPNGNNSTFKGLHFFNGFYNNTGSGTFIDFDRTIVANQPYLVDATINSVKGTTGSSGFQIYLYALASSYIHWQPFDDTSGTVTVFSFIADSIVKTWNLYSPGSAVRFHYTEQFDTALPTTGTYGIGQKIWNTAPGTGQPLGWIVTAAGTAGQLNGNATTGTATSGTNTIALSTATGLVVGQKIVCGANAGQVVTAISGTTAYVTPNWTANCAASGVFYVGPTIIPMQTGTNAGSITLSVGTGTATVASGSACVCTDSTANASVKCAVSTTTLTATGTGTDVIKFLCF